MGLSKYDQWKLASPPDDEWAYAYEKAEEEFKSGYLDGEFGEALNGEDLLEELYRVMLERHGRDYWDHFIEFLETHFPRLFSQARERVVERRAEKIVKEAD